MAWTTPPTYQPGFANRMTAVIANQQLRDNLNYLYRTFARKTADQSVTSSTAFIDDTHLKLPLLASDVFAWELLLIYDAATAGDLKIAFTVPASATGGWGVLGADVTTTTSVNAASVAAYGDANTISLGGLGAGVLACCFVQGTVANSTTPGNLQLRWAQVASSATSTILKINCFMIGYRVV
jgi:hypothetical protein